MRALADAWKKLSDSEKAKWTTKAEKRVAEYVAERKAYIASLSDSERSLFLSQEMAKVDCILACRLTMQAASKEPQRPTPFTVCLIHLLLGLEF